MAILSFKANFRNVGDSVVIVFDDKGWAILIDTSAEGSQTEGRSAFLTDGIWISWLMVAKRMSEPLSLPKFWCVLQGAPGCLFACELDL